MNIYNCTFCGREFQRYPSSVRNPERVYCNRICKCNHQKTLNEGENNPNYKHGYGNRPPTNKPHTKRTEQEIVAAIKEYRNFAQAAKFLGKNRKTVSKIAKKYGLISERKKIPNFDELLANRKGRSSWIRKFVLRNDLIDYRCQLCDIDEWCDTPLTLDLDHIDGDPSNNNLVNLRFLCPNCHSQTPTYSNKKRTQEYDDNG